VEETGAGKEVSTMTIVRGIKMAIASKVSMIIPDFKMITYEGELELEG
jgi:hypothetical protein